MMKRSDLKPKIIYAPRRLQQSPSSNKTWASARNPLNSIKSKKRYVSSNKVAIANDDYDDDDVFDQSEKDMQLNLHNRLIRSLPETKIIELIKLQSRKLILSEIETMSFIKYYKRNGKLDEGLEFLNNYAGHLDKCTKHIIEYTNLTHEFLIQLMNLETRVENSFRFYITEMIRLTTIILQTICLLRKFQKTPKPIIGYSDLNSQSIDSSFYTNTKSIITIMKEISIAITNNISGNIWKDFSCEELLVLLAPGIEEKVIEEIIMKVHSKTITMSQAHFAITIINIIQIEDKVESVWIAFQSLSQYHALEQDIDGAYFDPYESFPLLRVDYDNFIAPTSDHDWFENASTKYQQFLDLKVLSMLSSPSNFNMNVTTNGYSPYFNESMSPIENPRLHRSFNDSSRSNSMIPMSPITPFRIGTPIVYYENGSVLSSSFSRQSRNNVDNSATNRLDPSSIVSLESPYYNMNTSGTPYISTSSTEREEYAPRKASPSKKVTLKSPNEKESSTNTSSSTRPQSAYPKSPSSPNPRKIISAGVPRKQDCYQKSSSQKSIFVEESEQGTLSNETMKAIASPESSKSQQAKSQQAKSQKISLQTVAKQIVHNGLIRWLYRTRRRKKIEKQKLMSLIAANFTSSYKITLIVKIQRKIRQLMKRDESGLTFYRRVLMRRKAVNLLQRIARKFLACLYVYRYISASIVIKRIWIKFRSDRILRQNLRRVQVPLTLTLHALTNIPTHLVRFPEVKVKISIWDHYLLHIVRDMDVQIILQKKSPRIEFMTPLFSTSQTPTEDESLENKDSFGSNTNNITIDNRNGLYPEKSLKSLKEIVESEEEELDDSDGEGSDSEKTDNLNTDSTQQRRSIMQRVLSVRLPRLNNTFTLKQNPSLDPNVLSFAIFENFKLKVPGCHGNSVIKFGFYEGPRQFASCVFNLAKYNRLMFWGDEYTSEVNVVGVRRHAKIQGVHTSIADKNFDPATNYNNKSVRPVAVKENTKASDNCKFNFTIKAGAPMKSRAGYIHVKVKGQGKVKKAFMSKYLYKSLFQSGWVPLYVSMNFDGINFYDKRVSIAESFLVLTSEFDTVRSEKLFKEHGIRKNDNGKTEAFFQDTHAIIIKTLDGDEILLRFTSKQIRMQWMERLQTLFASVLEERKKNSIKKDQVFFKRLTKMISFTNRGKT